MSIRNVAGLLLIYLAISLELAPSFPAGFFMQQEGFNDFLKRLENYLMDAIPPDSEPIRECEYIIPDGFNNSDAEILWRYLAPFVSLGYSEDEAREVLLNATLSLGIKTVLNFTGIRIEKTGDGAVKLKIPVVSSMPLNYTYFNSTNVRVLYEVWNETLVRYYRVERQTGLYSFVIKDPETGVAFNVASRLLLGPYSNVAGVGNVMVVRPEENWPWFLGNPVIAVPGHYEDLDVLVPEQEARHRVLFPAYDPVITEGWLVYTGVSSTSVEVGETFQVNYEASYEGGDGEPLDAVLSIIVPDALQVVGDSSVHLDNLHSAGAFDVKALSPGLHNLTLRLEGNAELGVWPPSQETTYTIQVVGPASPSISVNVLSIDPSIWKHAKLMVGFSNSGGSAARNVLVEITGSHVETLSRRIGGIEAGEARKEELIISLKNPSSEILIRVSYSDDEGNSYLSEAETWVWTESYWVPEHFEEIVVKVPEHYEKRRVFVPDANYSTHVRFYTLTFKHPDYGSAADMPKLGEYYGGFELVSRLVPFSGEHEVSGNATGIGNPDFVMTSIQPHYEDLGTLDEGSATMLLGVEAEKLRANDVPEGYRVSLAEQFWVRGGRLILNSTDFAVYRARMEEFLSREGGKIASELRWGFAKKVNATRIQASSDEKGFLTLVYHPLSVRGSGALKTIQVRNYAGFNVSYVLKFSEYGVNDYMTPVGQPSKPPVSEKFSNPFQVACLCDHLLLAGSLASGGSGYRVQLLHGSRVVAEAFFNLYSEPSPFWTGFWDGIKEKAWGIVLTTAILVVLAIPTGGGSLLAEAKAFLTSTLIPTLMAAGVAANIMEIVEAYWAYDRMGKVADALNNFSSRAMGNGYENSSSFFRSLGDRIRSGQSLIVGNTALDLLADLTVRDLFIAFGRENATEYEKGRAVGRVAGTALSSILYAYTYYRLFTEGPRLLSWRGKIMAFLRSVYNWVTPPLWDFGVTMGRFAVKEFAASLTLSEQNQRFREYLNLVREDEASLSSVVEFTGKYLDEALDFAGSLRLSEKAFLSLLWAYGNGRARLGDEAWSRFLSNIQDIGGASGKCADELLRWMYDAEGYDLEYTVLEITPRLAELSRGELDNIGKALAARGIGSIFENGLKLLEAYFNTAKLEQYGKSIANELVSIVSKNPEILDVWHETVNDGYPIYFGKSPNTYLVPLPEDQSKIVGKVVYVYVFNPDTKEIVAEASRKVKQPTPDDPGLQEVFKFPDSNIKSSDNNLILIKRFTVEDFYTRYDVKERIAIKNGEAYYKDVTGKVLRQLGPGVLDGYKDEVWVEFTFRDLKGKVKPEEAPSYKLRISDSGYQMLIDPSGERNAVKEVELKSVKDESGNTISELLFAQTPEGSLRGIYLLSRNLPEGWKWCLSNEENAINLEKDQVKISVDDLFWRILDPQTYDKLKAGLDSDIVRIAVVFNTPSGKAATWKGTSSLDFMVPEGATGISKIYIVWANGFEQTIEDVTFKTFADTQGNKVEIKGPEGSVRLQANYWLTRPTTGKTILMIDLPYNEKYRPAFDIQVDNAGNLIIRPTLKYVLEGEIQNSWDVTKYEYQQTYYTSKGVQLDHILILDKNDGEKKFIGLTCQLPRGIEDNPDHALAVIHAEDTLKKKGYEEMKYEDYRETPTGRRYYDITARKQEKEVLVEVKTGIEKSFDESQITKDVSYLNSGDFILIYYYDNPPLSHGAKEYLRCIRQRYLENPQLVNRVFIIISEGNIVDPTDPSLDPYLP